MARKPARSRALQKSSSKSINCCRCSKNSSLNTSAAATLASSTSSSSSSVMTSSSKSKPVVGTKLLYLLFTIFACCLTLSHGYNIDLPSYTRHQRENGTMFGFSIAFHKAINGYPSLLVGAPKFNTTYYQEGVYEGGAVFRCSMNDNECGLVHFDSTGNHRNSLGDVIERKSNQWLGATVATSRDNDMVVACAPRYVFHTMTPTKSLRYDPVGTCFTSRNLTQFNEVSPCRTNNWGYHRQGSCQAGFSAAVSRKGDRVYIGAPGSWYWQGQIYSVSPDTAFPYKPPFYQPFGAGGQTYSHDVTRPENQVFSTAESSSLDDDSYLGYSMISGDFDGNGVDDVAIGMPRGVGLLGKIVVNRWDMVNLFNITGRQIGEYFGYALTAGDVDGDGLDDLIIGAPMYTEKGNAVGVYDVGRVYIHLQTSREESKRWTNAQVRDGYKTKGRFGLSLAYLGDINRDGYGDFAVGAPYDGPHGLGVVYIFHGSSNGPLEKPSQIIKAEDLVEAYPFPRTFGFSLAGGVDMDGNTYPDLAVGAYDSSEVYIFKSRPVAAVESTVTFLKQSKLIDLEEKSCRLINTGKAVPCIDIRTCWSYTGHKLPQKLYFDVSWVLDAKNKKQPRMFFLSNEGNNTKSTTIELFYGQNYCQDDRVYLENVRDKLTPLEVETTYNLHGSRGVLPTVYTRNRRAVLEPVIDQNREIVQHDALNIQKNCGPDNICIPDLRVHIKTYNEYLLGSGKTLPIEVIITNQNEDAFEAKFYLTIPKEIEYKLVVPIGDKNETSPPCDAPSEKNNYTLICDLGNPFPAKQLAHFQVVLKPYEKVGMSSAYFFHAVVNSTNEEPAGARIDNEVSKEIPIWADTTLGITGVSLPDFQLYKASDYRSVENSTKEEHLGPQVVHLYNIRNNGPSVVEEAEIKIFYPYETISGDLLMYVLNQPETHGNIHCEPHEFVNVRNLEWDETLRYKSYLALKVPELMYRKGEGEAASSSSSSSSSSSTSSSSSGSNTITTSSSSSSSGSSEAGGGIIEKPSAGTVIAGSRTIVTQKYNPSEADAKRLEEEDKRDSTGDASLEHAQRAAAAAAAEAAAAAARANNSYWHMESSETSGGNYGGASHGGPNTVTVHMRNRTTHYDGSGQPHTVESSTEFSTNVYSGDVNRFRQQPHSANYQQTSVNFNAGGSGAGQGQPQGQMGHQRIITSQQQAAPTVQFSNNFNARDHIQMPGAAGAGSAQYQHNYNSDPYRQQQQINYNEEAPTNLHKIVQGAGHGGASGFHHGTIELAPVGRQNVDQELQRSRLNAGGGFGGGAGGSGSYSQSYYSSTSRPINTYQQHISFNQGGGGGGVGGVIGSKPNYYGMENEDFYDETNHLGGGQHQQQRQWSNQRRYKRDDAAATTEPPKQFDFSDPCKAAKCKYIKCKATNLKKEDDVWIGIRMRIVAFTMDKLAGGLPLNVSTMAFSEVTRLPYIGQPKKAIKSQHEIFYKAEPEPTPVPDVVPLWVVVLAACAGALILLLLALLLYKCGFFNRNRPTNHPERQPLRNGYHGDEHL